VPWLDLEPTIWRNVPICCGATSLRVRRRAGFFDHAKHCDDIYELAPRLAVVRLFDSMGMCEHDQAIEKALVEPDGAGFLFEYELRISLSVAGRGAIAIRVEPENGPRSVMQRRL